MGLVYTPGDMLADADALASDFDTLARDVETSDVPEDFKSGWRTFADAWGAFYKGLHGVTGYAERLWGSTQDQIDSYRTQLRSWQDKFRAAGGAVTGPDVAPPQAAPDLLGALGDVKWIVLGALGIGILILYVRSK